MKDYIKTLPFKIMMFALFVFVPAFIISLVSDNIIIRFIVVAIGVFVYADYMLKRKFKRDEIEEKRKGDETTIL